MNLIQLVLIGFLILETSNVITLYFAPESKYANGMGVFNAWEESKQDPDIHNLVKYLVNWVAGTKLIFILLIFVIVLRADDQLLLLTAVVMTLSISTFFWRLFPLIRAMDRDGQVAPKNYSTTLGGMIFAFILIFILSIVVTFAS